jgi:hypothetical protein
MLTKKEKYKYTKNEEAFLRIVNSLISVKHNEHLTPAESYIFISMLRHKDKYKNVLTRKKPILINKGNLCKYEKLLHNKKVVTKGENLYAVAMEFNSLYILISKFGVDGLSLKLTHDKLSEDQFHFTTKML